MSEKLRGGGEWTALRERLAQAICEFHQRSRWSRDSESIYHAEADWILALPGAREALAAALSEPPAKLQFLPITDAERKAYEKETAALRPPSIPEREVATACESMFRADHGDILHCLREKHHLLPHENGNWEWWDEAAVPTPILPEAVAGNASAPVGEPQDFNAKFGGDIFVVTGEHQRTAFFSKAAAERYLAKQDPERFRIVVYAKPGAREVGEGLRELATYLLNTSAPDWEYDKVLTMAAESLAALAAPAPKPACANEARLEALEQAESVIAYFFDTHRGEILKSSPVSETLVGRIRALKTAQHGEKELRKAQ